MRPPPEVLGARFGCLAAVGLVALTVMMVVLADRRVAPSPDGLVLRVEFRETSSVLDTVVIAPAPEGRAAFLIRSREGSTYAIDEVTYPGGEVRRVVLQDVTRYQDPFDLDGDGTPDEVLVQEATVLVNSGADGRELFRQRDDLEYATSDRAFPLGDLDGDGYGELALFHPRGDRSDYDLNLADAMFGVTSWVTVVSGSRMASAGR